MPANPQWSILNKRIAFNPTVSKGNFHSEEPHIYRIPFRGLHPLLSFFQYKSQPGKLQPEGASIPRSLTIYRIPFRGFHPLLSLFQCKPQPGKLQPKWELPFRGVSHLPDPVPRLLHPLLSFFQCKPRPGKLLPASFLPTQGTLPFHRLNS